MIVCELLIVGIVLITTILLVMCKIEHRKWYNEREKELKDFDDLGDE